jgi:hypothetical protein
MNSGIFLIFIGVIACVLLVWYLYRRSQNETSENAEEPTDNADDEFEDLLLTGIVLGGVLDDADGEESDNMDSDGYDDGFDGGYDDSSGFE